MIIIPGPVPGGRTGSFATLEVDLISSDLEELLAKRGLHAEIEVNVFGGGFSVMPWKQALTISEAFLGSVGMAILLSLRLA